MKNIKRGFAVVLALVLVLGLLPAAAFAADEPEEVIEEIIEPAATVFAAEEELSNHSVITIQCFDMLSGDTLGSAVELNLNNMNGEPIPQGDIPGFSGYTQAGRYFCNGWSSSVPMVVSGGFYGVGFVPNPTGSVNVSMTFSGLDAGEIPNFSVGYTVSVEATVSSGDYVTVASGTLTRSGGSGNSYSWSIPCAAGYTNRVTITASGMGVDQYSGTVSGTGTVDTANGGSIAITADYTAKTNTVTFNSNGGSVVAAQYTNDGETAERPADPTREGYTFEGWFVGDDEYNFDTPVTGNVTLTAKWSIKSYTLIVIHKTASKEIKREQKTIEYGAEYTATPGIVGYTTNDTEVTGSMPAGDVEIFFTYTANTYTVTFVTNNDETVDPQEVIYGEYAEEPTKELAVPAGYRFGGWDFDFTKPITENVTVTALWIKQVTVTWYNENGAKVQIETIDKISSASELDGKHPTIASRSGYTLSWDVSIDEDTFDVTVRAVWTAIPSPGPSGPSAGGNPVPSAPAEEQPVDEQPEDTQNEDVENPEANNEEDLDENEEMTEIDEDGTPLGGRPLVSIDDEDVALSDKPFPFVDVKKNDWYYDAVKDVWERGMMNGTDTDKFSPSENTTRAMLVMILYRLEGTPAVESTDKFSDVAAGDWYAKAVAWASANGIVNGHDDGTFKPDDIITREQMAAILYRYATYKNMDTGVGENTNILSWNDSSEINDYAVPAIQWAVGAGLMNGTGDNTFEPQGGAERSHVATLLSRFAKLVDETTAD